MTPDRFDIAVVGAGAAGLTAALAFGREGFATALIGDPTSKPDGRTVALLDGSVRFLDALGIWPSVKDKAAPLAIMRIVDDTGSLFRPPPASFAAPEIGLEAFGWNVENADLVSTLAEAARECRRIAILPDMAQGMKVEAGRAVLALASGASVAVALVVAADGRRSRLRGASGLRARTWSYPQSALTTILAHERDHQATSTEFHTRGGPFTLVPLPGRRSSLVWVAGPERAEILMRLDDAALARAIEKQAHSILGEMRLEGPRGVVPLSGLSVEGYTAPRLALVGEAAHVLPPIGAQGLNLGLRDVAALRDALVDARSMSFDLGGVETLGRYQRSRELDVRLRSAAVDGLNRSLLSGLLPVDFLRGAGLLALASIGPLRRAMMREGVVPSLGAPRLMRHSTEVSNGAREIRRLPS